MVCLSVIPQHVYKFNLLVSVPYLTQYITSRGSPDAGRSCKYNGLIETIK